MFYQVYTINLESRYVMIQGVPAIGVMSELIQLCALYGVVEEYRPLDEYPAEEFTEVYLVKFQKLTSARFMIGLILFMIVRALRDKNGKMSFGLIYCFRAAKRYMDEKSFYGGVLHVCYVPEYETVEDTRLKLQDRKRYVIRAVQNKGMLYHPIPVYIKRTHKLKLAKYPFNNCVLCFFTFRYSLDSFFSY